MMPISNLNSKEKHPYDATHSDLSVRRDDAEVV